MACRPRNIVEVFVQVGLYPGFVTAETSAVAQDVFLARGLAVSPEPPPTITDAMLDRKGRGLSRNCMAIVHWRAIRLRKTPSRSNGASAQTFGGHHR